MRQTTSLAPKSWAYGANGQLRAVWRLGVVVSVYFLASGIITAVGEPVLGFLEHQTGGVIGSTEWLSAFAALAAVAVALRQVDAQPWAAVGLARANADWPNFAKGAALGSAAIGATLALVLVCGGLHWVPDTMTAFLSGDVSASPAGAWFASTARITLLLAPAAFFEELLFRGYLWRVAEDALGVPFALVVSSILFGLVHLQNPGSDALAIVNVILAGFALGLVRLATGSLYAAWAAHFMWNWIMAAGVHVAVSGLPMATPLYRAVIGTPSWLTGGDWGPEGGVLATVVLLAAIGAGTRHPSFLRTFPNLSRRAESAAPARSA